MNESVFYSIFVVFVDVNISTAGVIVAAFTSVYFTLSNLKPDNVN